MDKEEKKKPLFLKKETEHESLYAWSIQEEDSSDSDSEPTKYISFDYTLFFNVKSFSYISNIERNNRKLGEDEEDEWNTDTEQIRAELEFDTNHFRWTTLSFFGTSEHIESYTLEIFPLEDDSQEESCLVGGTEAYESEIDFEKENLPSALWFSIRIKKETFEELKSQILSKSLTSSNFSISNIDGFYAPWSPSIRPGDTKILKRSMEIEADDELEWVELTTIGKVGSWTFNKWSSQQLLFTKVDEEGDTDLTYLDSEESKNLTKEEHLQEKTIIELKKMNEVLNQAKKFAVALLVILVLILILL